MVDIVIPENVKFANTQNIMKQHAESMDEIHALRTLELWRADGKRYGEGILKATCDRLNHINAPLDHINAALNWETL